MEKIENKFIIINNFYMLFFLFSLFIINEVNCYLEFPIEYLSNENYKFLNNNFDANTKEKEEFMKQIYYKKLITKFEIGTPSKTQTLILNPDSHQYYLDSLNPPEKIQEKCKISDYLHFGEKEFFNETSSSSYIVEECKTLKHEYYDLDEICYSKEKIKFNINGNCTIKEFPIKIIKNHDEMVPGLIGLALNDTLAYEERSFLSELKLNNLINDYYWFIDFDKFDPFEQKIKGKFIVGDLPHNVFPEKYPKDEYYQTTSYKGTSFWTLNMKKVFIENKTEEYHLDSNQAALFYDFYPIIGTKEFWGNIKDKFMDKLVEEKKCFTGTFSQNIYSFDDLLFYYCDKSAQNTLYENLPSINFVSGDLKYTFQFTKEELFYTKGDYIYFMILFCPNQFNNWIFGQIFTSKYHFVFHTDQRQIGFYHKVNIIDETNSSLFNINDIKNSWISILITAFVFTILGFFLGTIFGVKFCGKRKRKANELIDDNYEYNSKE